MPSIAPIITTILQAQTPTLQIAFPKVTITSPGQVVAKALTESAPTLRLRSPNGQQAYLAISLDPDAPFVSLPFLSPILHSCQTGLTGADTQADEDGWTNLTAVDSPAAPWIPPNPPRISGPHRYIFLVWEQPEGITQEKVREMMGWGENVGLGKRVRWDVEGFVKKLGLGEVVGGGWFKCG